jgi:hypothetical protein
MVATPALSRAAWRTSSYSGNGGNCVQVAALDGVAWRTSSRSNNGGACVEVATVDGAAWRTSSRSNNGGDCVQVTDVGPVIAVRDSKDPGGPHLDFTPAEWHTFVTSLKAAD